MELTPGELQEILKIFVESELRELQLQVGDVTLAVSKNESDGNTLLVQPRTPESDPAPRSIVDATSSEAADGPAAATAEPAPSQVDRSELHELRSPLVGVFYRRPGPDQPPYVEVGDVIKQGDPVCTISVMKMFTEVGADRGGRVVEICVENEVLVEHGQVLMYIDPSDED